MRTRLIYTFTLVIAAFMLLTTETAKAQDERPLATNTQVRTLLTRIGTETAAFRQLMQRAVDRSGVNDPNNDDRIMDVIGGFENATLALRTRVDSRQAVSSEVSDVLNSGLRIDGFMTRNQMTGRTGSQWVALRNDLNTLARYFRVSWSWDQPVVTTPVNGNYNATEDQLRDLIAQIENKTQMYKTQMVRTVDRDRINDAGTDHSITGYIADLENATDSLKDRFNSGQSTGTDVSEVLTRARYIDQYMTNNRVDREAVSQWSSLRTDLNTLGTYYRLSWDWNQQIPTNQGNNFPTGRRDARMTGTYRLNARQSDNVADAINNVLQNNATDQPDNVRRMLERRLNSPAMIAIEKNGNNISIGSSNSAKVTFDADGDTKTETNARGKTVTTTVNASEAAITINYEGDRVNDFYVTFAIGQNRQLNVTRKIYIENRNEAISVSSVYDKISDNAQWPTVNTGPVAGDRGVLNNFYVSNGTRMTASMTSTVDTRASQAGDRFTMEVTSPSQFRGAVLEGTIAKADNSGRFSGRANISLVFDTIRMNGRSYSFAGIIESVSAANGDAVSVNNEGTIRDSNQTNKTVARAGIGAVIGAIIGAVAGGGEGAAIGAGVGAGAGVGSVLVTGRDSIVLGPGSSINLTATAPAGVANNRNN